MEKNWLRLNNHIECGENILKKSQNHQSSNDKIVLRLDGNATKLKILNNLIECSNNNNNNNRIVSSLDLLNETGHLKTTTSITTKPLTTISITPDPLSTESSNACMSSNDLPQNDVFRKLTSEELMKLKSNSSSAAVFSSKLLLEICDHEFLKNKKINGRNLKNNPDVQQLPYRLIEYLKTTIFKYYDDDDTNKKRLWSTCTKEIHRLLRKFRN